MNTISQTLPTSLTLETSLSNNVFGNVFGEFIGQLLPENYPIIQEQLATSPELRQQFSSILENVAALLEEHDTVEDFENAINNEVALLSRALDQSEDSFYETPPVKTARANLYALQSGFDNGSNLSLIHI